MKRANKKQKTEKLESNYEKQKTGKWKSDHKDGHGLRGHWLDVLERRQYMQRPNPAVKCVTRLAGSC
jgi:hypothetical protein